MKNNCLATIVFAGLMCLASGCSTLAVRPAAEARRGMPLYGATRFDFMTIRTGGGIYAYGDDDNGFGPVFGWLIAVPLSVVDIPISVVTDSLCMPWDITRISQEKQSTPRPEWFVYRVESNTDRILMERRLRR